MAKISEDFQHDVFRFIIQSRRNDLLERWFGTPDSIGPERSVQGQFEATQERILDLPKLIDPGFDKAKLRLLAWNVGWDDAPEVDFISGLDENALRKLITLSVPLWKQKGSGRGLVNAIRVFTGKTAVVRDWFWHRWILDESGLWLEAKGSDPYLVGGIYTQEGETLTWVILNRQGLTETDRRLVYDLLTYTRVIGEHYGLVYAAFIDDFTEGLDQWTQIGTPGTLVVNEDDFRGGLLEGASVRTNFTVEEMATWTPFQNTIAYIEFATDGADEEITLEVMRSEDGSTSYSAKLTADGSLELRRSGNLELASTITLPSPGFPVGLEIKVEPISSAEQQVSIFVGAELKLQSVFLGVDAYIDSAGGVVISREGSEVEPTYIDNVMTLATPNRVQFIGQNAIPPTPGFGGPEYIANPDPGVEPFTG